MEFIETTKGSRQLCKDGYLYNKTKNLTNRHTYWECIQRRSGIGCKVKITLDAGDRFVAQAHVHSHDPDPEQLPVVKASAGMKRAAKDTAEKTQNIIALNVEGLNEDTLARLSNVETLRRDVRCNRNAIHPIVPDAQEKLFIVPPNYMVNALGQQFLIYDNQRQDRILLFSTPESLRFLANADNWFMGGTFKFSPLQFTQLYTIHGLSSGRNVVGAYALLPDKRMVTYAEMPTQIQRLRWCTGRK